MAQAQAQAQAQNRAHRIQHRIDDNVADIPIFHGNFKDTETLKQYVSRIDQGITALGWSQETAFTYFSNSVKSRAGAWLECYKTDNPELPLTWAEFKPHFRKAFGDVTDPIVFAQELCNIRPEHHGNCLYTYYAEITRAVNLHQEKFLTPPPLPELAEQEFDEEQVAFINTLHQQTHQAAVRTIHTTLRQEFFLNGLPKKQLDLVANKPQLKTVNDMIEFIHLQETVEKKKTTTTTTTQATPLAQPLAQSILTTAPEPEKEEVVSASQQQYRTQNFRGNGGRGQNFSGYRGNTNNYRGNGNGNRGTYYNGNRGGGYDNRSNFQNYQAQSQATNTTTGTGKTCIYCKKLGHIQDVCRTRINRNEPCIDSQGRGYFPKPNISVQAMQPEISSNSVFFLEN